MAVDHWLEDPDQKKRLKKLLFTILLVVVGIHIGGGVLAGIWVVARYFAPPPATFEVKRDIRLPAQKREHQMRMAEFDAMTPKPSFNDKLQSLRPTAFALPELPKIPVDQMLPLDPAAIVSDTVSSLAGTAGLGVGGQGAGGMGGIGGGISFLGIETQARRIVILYDVSDTTIRKAREAGMPFSRIKAETERLLETLGVNTRFGLVMFARNYVLFRPELLAATDANRQEATNWLNRYFTDDKPMAQSIPGLVRGSPGFKELLKAVFQMEPDAVFIISDGGFYEGSSSRTRKIPYSEIRVVLAELQKTRRERVAVYFIGANMDATDRGGMRRILRQEGGRGTFQDLKLQ